jgi:hypothetical protein
MVFKQVMNTIWIVENFVKEPPFKGLTEAAKKLGVPLIEINGDYSPNIFVDKLKLRLINEDGGRIYANQCVIINGSIKMCKLLKEELEPGCYPLTYSSFEKYKCSAYYSHFGPYLFNDKYCMMSLKELVRQKYDVWGHYGKDGMIFIRPDSGEKTFQAGLLDIIDVSALYDNNKDCENDLILVSTPKLIKWEGRFVVSRNKEIIAASTYRFQGKVTIIPSVPTETTKFCKELLNNTTYQPDSVFCFDICEDNDGVCWLMELTSFSSAGLYACNKEDIITKVSAIAEDDYAKHLEKI